MREIRFEAPSWDYLYGLLLDLVDKIGRSGFKPDIIVGVSRGGWVPARVLSDLLDNSNLANVRVEFYTGIYETAKKPVITQPVSLPVKDKRILVVDDIVDSGESLRLVCDMLSREAREVKIVTLYYKPWSVLKPDYYCRETDAWVVFPWELCETAKTIGSKMLEEGKCLKDVEAKLVEMGLSAPTVRKIVKNVFRGTEK